MTPIEKIHSENKVAVIDCDLQKIIGSICHSEVDQVKVIYEAAGYDVVIDRDGDLCLHTIDE